MYVANANYVTETNPDGPLFCVCYGDSAVAAEHAALLARLLNAAAEADAELAGLVAVNERLSETSQQFRSALEDDCA